MFGNIAVVLLAAGRLVGTSAGVQVQPQCSTHLQVPLWAADTQASRRPELY